MLTDARNCGLLLVCLLALVSCCIAAAPGGGECQCDTAGTRSILMELFVRTNGSTWKNNTGWGLHSVTPVCDWFGITCKNSNVVSISLSQNNLVGTLPASLASLTHLEELRFYDEGGVSGTLPSSWGALTLLKTLVVSDNHIFGPLPDSWSGMRSLEDMILDHNELNGTLPQSWHALRSMIRFDVRKNRLTGILPESWAALTPNLSNFIAYGNRLSGTLPSSWSNMRLYNFDVSYNSMSGTLPSSWGNMTSLHSLVLSANHLSGSIPAEWAPLRLFWLYLDNNHFSGVLEPCAFKGLELLEDVYDFTQNSFSGKLDLSCIEDPCETATWGMLKLHIMCGNRFCGVCSLPECDSAAASSSMPLSCNP